LTSAGAPSAPSAVAGTEVTSPLVLASSPNVQSTPMGPDLALSGGRVQLNTDLSVSAMLGPVFHNRQIPANWWGYGMPPKLTTIGSRLPQVSNAVGKAPISSVAPVSLMTQLPQYATWTTVQPISGGF